MMNTMANSMPNGAMNAHPVRFSRRCASVRFGFAACVVAVMMYLSFASDATHRWGHLSQFESPYPNLRHGRGVPVSAAPSNQLNRFIGNIHGEEYSRGGIFVRNVMNNGAKPVSYTHLDVYKRQNGHRLQSSNQMCCQEGL